MTTHAAAVPEAALPPLTEGPYRKRIGLISIVACLGGLLFGYDTGVSNGAEGPMAKRARAVPAAGGHRHQLAHIRRRGRSPHRRKDLRRDRPPQDDHRPRGHVLRRRAVRRLLAQLRDPGGRPDHSRARGRGCLDGGAGVPCGAGAVRDPRVDHGPQRAGDRRRASSRPSWSTRSSSPPSGTSMVVWRIMFGVCALPAIALFFGMLRMPESPRWLVEKGRDEEALAVLKTVRSEDRALAELRQVETSPRGGEGRQSDQLRGDLLEQVAAAHRLRRYRRQRDAATHRHQLDHVLRLAGAGGVGLQRDGGHARQYPLRSRGRRRRHHRAAQHGPAGPPQDVLHRFVLTTICHCLVGIASIILPEGNPAVRT